MKVIIVEDEPLIANRIERTVKNILGNNLICIVVKNTIEDAKDYLFNHNPDLLFLDLNLNGKDGFDLLKLAVSGSFHTIIISAYSEKAIEAFEFGVLDFIEKPFTEERLKKALERLHNFEEKNQYPTKFVAVRKNEKLLLVNVDDIKFIKGAGIYSELILKDNSIEIHDKTLNYLNTLLPSNFVRTHKSYIVNIRSVANFSSLGGSKYELTLTDGQNLPVSRTRYKEIKELLTK